MNNINIYIFNDLLYLNDLNILANFLKIGFQYDKTYLYFHEIFES